MRLLMVDDEAVMRDVVAEILGEQGYKVETVATAQEALRLLALGDYDFLISDIEMPYVDGLQLVQEMQERKITTKVILQSGTVAPEDVEKYQSYFENVVGVIKKPYSSEEILRFLRAA